MLPGYWFRSVLQIFWHNNTAAEDVQDGADSVDLAVMPFMELII